MPTFVREGTHGPSMQVQQQLVASVPNSTFPRAKTGCACFNLPLIPDGEHKRFTAAEIRALTPTPLSQVARVHSHTRSPCRSCDRGEREEKGEKEGSDKGKKINKQREHYSAERSCRRYQQVIQS